MRSIVKISSKKDALKEKKLEYEKVTSSRDATIQKLGEQENQ